MNHLSCISLNFASEMQRALFPVQEDRMSAPSSAQSSGAALTAYSTSDSSSRILPG